MDRKLGALPQGTIDAKFPAVPLRDVLNNCQPKACATSFTRAAAIYAVKPLGQAR